MEVCIYIGVVYVTWQLCFLLIRKQDTFDAICIAFCMRGPRIFSGIGIGIYAWMIRHAESDYLLTYVLAVVIAISLGCFIFAVFSDLAMQRVYRFCWYGVYGGCGILGILKYISTNVSAGEVCGNYLCDLFLFAFIQFVWFERFYGRADCHGFFAGACILALFDGSFWDYVMQMAYAFGILLVIQLFRKNVNRRGNLKRTVAFLPYVAAGLLLRLAVLNPVQIVR